MSLPESTLDNIHRLAEPEDPVMVQWARFRDRFAEALAGSRFSIEDLEQAVATHRAWLFAGKDSAIIGETGDGVMHLAWACGDLAEIIAMLPGIETVARMQGCDRMLVEGQRAWERVLKAAGYGFSSVALEKGL